MQDEYQVRIGGSVEKALKGDYQLDFKGIMSEGWSKTVKTNWVMFAGLVLIFTIGYVVMRMMLPADALTDMQQFSQSNNIWWPLLVTLLTTPLTAAIQLMGIRHSLGVPSRLSQLFVCVPLILPLAVTELSTSVLVDIGLSLLVLPGVLLFVASCFAIPLVAERKMNPFQSIWLSVRVMLRNVPLMLFMLVLMLVCVSLCVITYGLGTVWFGPLYYNIKGILYRDIFGAMVYSGPQSSYKANDESTFDA